MRSIWTMPFSDLNASDILTFLALDEPLSARPREGTRLDFKEDWEDDLGKHVCAFANSDGGLIIFGVEEKDAIPTRAPGFKSRSEPELRISDHIRTTVTPIPRFEVAARIDGEGRKFAIVRIEPGPEFPYFFRQGDERCFVRRGAQSKMPVRDDLLALVNRRNRESQVKKSPDLLRTEGAPYLSGGQVKRATNGVEIRLAPFAPSNAPFDSRTDEAFIKCVEANAPHLSGEIWQLGYGADHFEYSVPSAISFSCARWRVDLDASVTLMLPFIGDGKQFWSGPDAVSATAHFIGAARAWAVSVCGSTERATLSATIDTAGWRFDNTSRHGAPDLPLQSFDSQPQSVQAQASARSSYSKHASRHVVVRLDGSDEEWAEALACLWLALLRALQRAQCTAPELQAYVREQLASRPETR